MTDWQDTGAELGAELQAAKTAAIAAFMAAPAESEIGADPAIPPVLSRQQRATLGIPLSSGDRSKVITVTWRALASAHLKHIGPVSSDGSVLIGIQENDDGIPQLDLRSKGGSSSTKTSALTWVSAYDKVFGDLDSQGVSDDGAVDLGDGCGPIWVARNRANAGTAPAEFGIVHGTGLKILAVTGVDAHNLLTAPVISAYLGSLSTAFAPDPWSQLDLWIWVQANWENRSAMVVGSNDRIIVGFAYSHLTTGVLYPLLGWKVRQWSGYKDAATFEQHMQHVTSPSYAQEAYKTWNNDTETEHDVFCFHVRPGYHVDGYFGTTVDGNLPQRKDLTFCGTTMMQASGINIGAGIIAQAFYPTIYFGAQSAAGAGSGGASGHPAIIVKRLKVEYLSVAETIVTRTLGFFDVTITDGSITSFATNRNLRAYGIGPLVGIQDVGFEDGEPMSITFGQDTAITSMGATGLVPIRGPWDQAEGAYVSITAVPSGEEIRLKYITNSGGSFNGGLPYFRYDGGSFT